LPIDNGCFSAIDLGDKLLLDFLYIMWLCRKECYSLPYCRVGPVRRAMMLAGYIVGLDDGYNWRSLVGT
jgi:hypothetical protein